MIHTLIDAGFGLGALAALTSYIVVGAVTTMQLRDRFIFAACTRWGCERCGMHYKCRAGCSHPCEVVAGARVLAGVMWPVSLPALLVTKVGTRYVSGTLDVSQRVSGKLDGFRGPDNLPPIIAIERERDRRIGEINEQYARGALPEGERDRKVIEILHLEEGELKP